MCVTFVFFNEFLRFFNGHFNIFYDFIMATSAEKNKQNRQNKLKKSKNNQNKIIHPKKQFSNS